MPLTLGQILILAMAFASPGTLDGANILGLLPFHGRSHNVLNMAYMEELANRGHNVTIVGYFASKNPSIKSILLDKHARPLIGFRTLEEWSDTSIFTTLTLGYEVLQENNIKRNKDKMKATADETYDLVILEYFESDLFVAFVAKLGVPFILFHTSEPFPWHKDALADPNSPSIIPHCFNNHGANGRMDFEQRFWNTFELISIMTYYSWYYLPFAQKTAENYLGPLPPLNELTKNASLYLINAHTSLFGPRPMNPSTIEVGGIHVFPPQPLPKDLKALLDNAKHGVIYFSMGSVLKGSSMNPKKRDSILKVFSELNETVLWKWEDELPNKSLNVHTSPWFPQRDIFAHPNVVLYIGHCGLLGIHEAVTEALPIICLPIFGDQHFNAAALKRNGMGLDLNYADITEDLFREIIHKVLINSSFKENAVRVSAAFLDRPMSAMDTAIYWTEYVIRHKGAPHLKSPARYMKWWEYNNIDVIGVMLLAVMSVIVLTYKMIKSFLTLPFCRGSQRKIKTH